MDWRGRQPWRTRNFYQSMFYLPIANSKKLIANYSAISFLTRNMKLETRNSKLFFIVNCPLSIVNCQLSRYPIPLSKIQTQRKIPIAFCQTINFNSTGTIQSQKISENRCAQSPTETGDNRITKEIYIYI